MKKEEMVCLNCLKFSKDSYHGSRGCHRDPTPMCILEPDEHWCGDGVWKENEGETKGFSIRWGDWDRYESKEKGML